MRVLIAGAHRGVVGGAETYVRDLMPALLERGHQVAFLHELSSPSGDATVDDRSSDLPRWCVQELGIAEALGRAQKWNPDVVCVQGLRAPRLESALLDQHPAALFAHSYYGTCATGIKRHAFPGVRMCSRHIGPGCLVLHYPRRCGGLNPLTMFRSYDLQMRRYRLLRRYRVVLVASRHMRTEYIRHGLPADSVTLAPYAPTGITPDSEPPLARKVVGRLLFVGRLTDLKGGEYLIRAMVEASKTLELTLTLDVLGAGPEQDRLKDLARRLRVRVAFAGWVDTERRNDFFRSSDLLVLPSLWPEPYGLVGAEAGCVGLPTVAFDVGGVPDWLEAGKSGELAPASPPTPDGLSSAIVRALQNPEHYLALRRGAWETARKLTMDAHLAVLEPVLESVKVGSLTG